MSKGADKPTVLDGFLLELGLFSDPVPDQAPMKRRLMEILACPLDKHHPLELHVFEEKEEIVEGMLTCPECGRWYPIIDEIPELLPDDLREARQELKWLEKWKEKAPRSVLDQGKPFTLSRS